MYDVLAFPLFRLPESFGFYGIKRKLHAKTKNNIQTKFISKHFQKLYSKHNFFIIQNPTVYNECCCELPLTKLW